MVRATDMDIWKRSVGISRRDQVHNNRVHQVMVVENNNVFDIMMKQPVWYGCVNSNTKEKLPKKMHD